MAVYTKGPWELDSYSLRGESYTAIDGEGWGELATVVTRMHSDTEDSPEGMANARLIAAAPDLLEALEELIECQRGDWPLRQAEAKRQARKAIAKAKGEV